MKTQIKVLVAALAMGLFAGGANAAASYCVGGATPHPDGLAVTDMTYNSTNADDCYGVVSGNDSNSTINAIADNGTINWDDPQDWFLLVKDETAAASVNTFAGLQFSLDSSGFGKTGTWTLTVTDLDLTAPLALPATLDFVGVLKASDRYAAYLFDDVIVDGLDGGTWSIAFTKNGNTPDLSHLSLYVRSISDIPPPPPPQGAPEPGVLLLMGAGLLGLGMARRRKSA